MASSTVTNTLFRFFIICLMIDIGMKYFLKPNQQMIKKSEQIKEKDKYENPLKDVDIDTSLDEDDEFTDKKKPKKKKEKETEEEQKEEEKEIKDKKNKKDKKKKKKEDDEDEDDELNDNKEVITIIYDKKSFGKYYEGLKNEIMGNFTDFDIEEKEYPLPPVKKFFSKITFFTQMGVSLLTFSGQKLKDKLTMIPASVFDGIEKNKWFVMIGNFLFHQWLNKNLSTTGAFEIYFKGKIIFSKLSSNRLPKERDIHSELKKFKNKSNKNGKKSKNKEYDEDNDDDDL